MSQFTIYKSTDASAPVLTGQTGSLVALLDACLVNGYGAKAAAGWTKAYAGTSKAAYRAASGTRLYLRVQDDGPGAGTFKEARITGYETMSDVDTGTGPFPTAAQGVGGIAMRVVRKSVSADAVARDWIVLADARTAYVFIKSEVAVGVGGIYMAFGFGEICSLVNSDAYNCFLSGRGAENSAIASNDGLDVLQVNVSSGGASTFLARNYLGTGTSLLVNRVGNTGLLGSNSGLVGTMPYPNPPDGGLYLSRVWVGDPTTAPVSHVRGWMRGFYQFLHAIASVGDGDTFNGSGDFAGRSFLVIKTSGNNGVYVIETSNTLDTN